MDIAPAKVVSLYPSETVSGPLHVSQEDWVQVFGGPEGGKLSPAAKNLEDGKRRTGQSTVDMLKGIAHLGGGKKDTASIRGKDNGSIKGKDMETNSVMGDETTTHESSKDSIVEYESTYVPNTPLARD